MSYYFYFYNMKRKNTSDNENMNENANKQITVNYDINLVNTYKTKIDELTHENTNLNKRIKILEDEIIVLNIKYDEISEYSLYKKYIIAIQDLNAKYHLESKVSENTLNSLKELKNLRNDECHYLNRKYKKVDINDRLYVIWNVFENMPQNIKSMFDDLFPNLIDEIKTFINTTYDTLHLQKPSQDALDVINKWWRIY